MRDYLVDFLDRFGYDTADVAVLLAAYDRLAQDARWDEALGLYEADVGCDQSRVIALADEAAVAVGVHEYTAELLIFLCMSRRLKREYEVRGWADDIFTGSMLDLKYKLEECKLVKGIVGSFVASWFRGFFDLTRVALGRLQFEVVKFGHTYEKDGVVLTPESPVINVHIPRTGTPMRPVDCDEAFAWARTFFADEVGDPCAFVCQSWLLYPAHEEMLSHESNVYRFMKRFDLICSGDSRNMGDLWRLFDTDEKRWDKLPADSSLRRAYVERLKAGGRVGWGHGVYIMK